MTNERRRLLAVFLISINLTSVGIYLIGSGSYLWATFTFFALLLVPLYGRWCTESLLDKLREGVAQQMARVAHYVDPETEAGDRGESVCGEVDPDTFTFHKEKVTCRECLGKASN